jgi:hypothetical protein
MYKYFKISYFYLYNINIYLEYSLRYTLDCHEREQARNDPSLPSLRGVTHRGNPYENGTRDVVNLKLKETLKTKPLHRRGVNHQT